MDPTDDDDDFLEKLGNRGVGRAGEEEDKKEEQRGRRKRGDGGRVREQEEQRSWKSRGAENLGNRESGELEEQGWMKSRGGEESRWNGENGIAERVGEEEEQGCRKGGELEE